MQQVVHVQAFASALVCGEEASRDVSGNNKLLGVHKSPSKTIPCTPSLPSFPAGAQDKAILADLLGPQRLYF